MGNGRLVGGPKGVKREEPMFPTGHSRFPLEIDEEDFSCSTGGEEKWGRDHWYWRTEQAATTGPPVVARVPKGHGGWVQFGRRFRLRPWRPGQ